MSVSSTPRLPNPLRFAYASNEDAAQTAAMPGSLRGTGSTPGRETMKRRTVLAGLGAGAAAGLLGMPSILKAQAPVALNGAVQFNDDHAFNRALIRFEELVQK